MKLERKNYTTKKEKNKVQAKLDKMCMKYKVKDGDDRLTVIKAIQVEHNPNIGLIPWIEQELNK